MTMGACRRILSYLPRLRDTKVETVGVGVVKKYISKPIISLLTIVLILVNYI